VMAKGIPVYGAASLGALRAAELAPLGMRGVGDIFEAYRRGDITRDDAVMLVHAPAELNYRPLTTSLVDAESTLAAMELPPEARRVLQRIVRTLSFRTRTWSLVLDLYRQQARCPIDLDLAAFDATPSLKRQDALCLVEVLAGPLLAQDKSARPPLTTHYRRLLASALPMQQ